MIPRVMHQFLHDVLPEQTWQNRLKKRGGGAFMEFGPLDVERLHRMGIEVDRLGPQLVVCMWDTESPLEIGGYLVVDNLAMGRPSMGGIRMLPDLTPAAVYNLARGMTLKNAAADLPYGGGKSGIVSGNISSLQERTQVIRGFAHLIREYQDIYLPGPDVGTDDADMKTIAIENGLDCALSKPADMGGSRIDLLGAAAAGVVIAIDTLLEEITRLTVLPQFANLSVPSREDLTLLIQGFGAVGANVARILTGGHPHWQDLGLPPHPKITGVSDAQGYLFCEAGLPIRELLKQQAETSFVTFPYFERHLSRDHVRRRQIKYASACDDLLRESAFCLVPAAPVAHYLDVDGSTGPSMTTDRMGRWAMIVEGANTYSPDPGRKAARARMERAVYWQAGVLIATDYLVNSGGVIFAAQERLIKTPDHLGIPETTFGDAEAVERWLVDRQEEFAALAEQRRLAGQTQCQQVVRRNMTELIDRLVADPDLLPCEAAELISIGRIACSESYRTAADVLEPLPVIAADQTVGQAAQMLIEHKSDMLAVVADDDILVGIITDWDVTRASARRQPQDMPLAEIMTRHVITAGPSDSILDVVHKLEYHEISAMPVVDQGRVLGAISGDMLARKTLFRLLQTQESDAQPAIAGQ